MVDMELRREVARLEENICLSAGAGAGKTTCLVETYFSLLRGAETRKPLKPAEIYAITFTEKAAAEMKHRLVKRLSEAEGDTPDKAEMQRLESELEWAPISTIHSFCGELLRNYGVAIGLDPEFAILDEEAYAGLKEEVIEQVLAGLLKNKNRDLALLLADWPVQGNWSLAGFIDHALDRMSTLGLLPEEVLKRTLEAYDGLESRKQAAFNRLEEALAGLTGHRSELMAAGKKSQKYIINSGDLIELWHDYLPELADAPCGHPEYLSGLLALTSGNWYALKPYRLAIISCLEELFAIAAAPQNARVSLAFLKVLAEVNSALNEGKERVGGLSFDDLLLKALHLLEYDPKALAELRAGCKVLMVDEYQDVNPVQGRMVRILAGLEPGFEGDDAPSLLLVGDRKQSIYAFRGADVSEFNQTMSMFEGDGCGKLVALPENFRSSEALISFFNTVSEKIFGDHDNHGADFVVDFTESDVQTPGREKYQSAEAPAVNLLDTSTLFEEIPRNVSLLRTMEAKVLAGRMAEMFSSGDAAPGDSVILLRRLSNVQIYENALKDQGIDYYTVRSRGYYACPEIRDMAFAMQAIVGHDDLALAALLRSPLVGLSDQVILGLCYPSHDNFLPLYNSIAADYIPDWCSEVEKVALGQARQTLKSLTPLAGRMRPHELISAVLDAFDVIPKYLALPGGEQKVANLRKLLEQARNTPGVPLGQYLGKLQKAVDDPPNDPQAPLSGEGVGSQVLIMSIHQAKGLEFKHVFLPDLGGKSGGNNAVGADIDDRGRLIMRGIDHSSGDTLPNIFYNEWKEQQKAMARAESARLFYVACTRAEESLTLFLNGNQKDTWSRWVEDFVQTMPEVNQNLDLKAMLAENQAEASRPELTAELEPGRIQEIIEQAHPAPWPVKRVRISVSALEDWLHCPRLWGFGAFLGLDTAWLPSGSKGGGSSVALGSAVHKVLEVAGLSGERDILGAVDQVATQQNLDENTRRKVRENSLAVLTCDFWQNMSHLPERGVNREQGFRLWLPTQGDGPEVELIGEFDLLTLERDGNWLIVDYKVTPHVEPEKYRTQLLYYSLAAWQGLGEGQGPVPKAGLCYLFDGKAQFVSMDFSRDELDQARETLYRAASEIAILGPEHDVYALPGAEDCRGCAMQAICGQGT